MNDNWSNNFSGFDYSNQGDIFQLLPPTPRNQSPAQDAAFQQPAVFNITPTNPFGSSINPRLIAPQLQPAPINPSWRSHRSTSSIDSYISEAEVSDMDWTNVKGDSSSGPDSTPPPPARKGSTISQNLSIDPSLLRPRQKVDVPEDVMDEEEDMKTAKPKKVKDSKGKANSKEKRMSSHARKNDENHIPRPRNAFILFRKHVVDAKLIPASVEVRHQNVSVIVAKMWADAPQSQKDQFNELARIEKEDHLKKYPGYRYQPVYRRTNVIRRQVRRDEAEDEKCKSVAELLLKGKSGEELEEVIKEKLGVSSIASKTVKGKRGGQANELSKGALRALRAQARKEATQSEWTSDTSRTQSVASSRTGSPDLDTRQESIFDDGQSGLDMYDQNGMLDGQGICMDNGGIFPGFNGQAFGIEKNQIWGMSGQVQQTWAYPEPELPAGVVGLPHLAYAQPNIPGQNETNNFFTFDQALPFSPTAQAFHQPTFDTPSYSNQIRSLAQSTQPNPMFAPHFLSPPQMVGSLPMLQNLNKSPFNGYQPLINSHSNNFSISSNQIIHPPATARWNSTFQPGVEGMPFDENALLGDFGEALMQAEEMVVW